MNASTLCAIATVSPGGRAHISHVYFAWNDSYEVFWISDPDSLHSRNLATNRTAGVSIYDSRQVWGRPDRGIHLFGAAGEVSRRQAAEAQRAYAARFRGYDTTALESLCFYRFHPRTLHLFDERSLDAGTLVTVKIAKDRLTWLRTEVWT
jgi:pyridoxine/pyridoxamine 5'-phosphate oxidase